MPQITLTPAQRKVHRADAHHLDPVVLVGGDGLSPSVKKEIEAALKSHGLIKVRVFSDDRSAREAMLQTLADELDAAPIQHIGKLLVLWRPLPAKEERPDSPDRRASAPRVVKLLTFSKSGSQRAQVKKLTIFGNQRLTAGGIVKRSKKRLVGSKKRAQSSE